MDEIIDEIKYFANERIWKTKKARMEAEARLKSNHLISNILINYYTFFVLGFSIWSLVLESESEKAKYVTLMTLISSVGLFGVSLLITTLGYREKAVQFKESYIKLDSLESDFKHLLRSMYRMQKEEVIDEFHSLEKKYFDILTLSDNHNQIDMEKVSIDRQLKGFEKMIDGHKLKKRVKYVTIFLLFSFPPILVLILLNI